MRSIISADDHVVEPANIWIERLPDRFKAVGPRIERRKGRVEHGPGIHRYVEHGSVRPCDVWVYEDRVYPLTRSEAAVGFDYSEHGDFPVTFEEVRAGCHVPSERLKDMDASGIGVSINYPNNTIVGFAGQHFLNAKDKNLALLCIRAYNDWIIEEWCGIDPHRLVPVCILPLWDPRMAAAEVERVSVKGCTAISFPLSPESLGLPSTTFGSDWKPMLDVCQETSTTIAMHVVSSKPIGYSPSAPVAPLATLTFLDTLKSITEWLTCGLLVEKYRGLRLVYAECGIGWIPFVLERADRYWTTHWAWAWGDKSGKHLLPEPPSSYFSDHFLCTFVDDLHGLKSISDIGSNNIAITCDYPHAESSWHKFPELLESIRSSTDPTTFRKLTQENAQRFFRIEAGTK